MALCFALGSTCFLIGPFPGYASLVGDAADAITFFVGSILFTIGGAHAGGIVTMPHGYTALSNSSYDKLVWRPDVLGSICFLVSGVIAYRASPRYGWLPARGGSGWWQPTINLTGCIFFGISAAAGYAVPSTGSILDQAAANWNTSLGAACFLACALDTLFTDEASKVPGLHRLRELEHALDRDVHRVI